MEEAKESQKKVIRDARLSLSPYLPLPTILTYVVIAFFIFAFFSGLTYKFYASVLFLFYSLLGSMWISVVCLGLFQAILMIPFRIINLKISNHIKEFKEKTGELKSEEEQTFLVKSSIRRGDRPLLFYTIDFVVQLTLYVSIGRLFLTDFYREKLNPDLLFSFVEYPGYPIKDTIFKIPYPAVTRSKDLGVDVVLIAWGLIVLFQLILLVAKQLNRRQKDEKKRLNPPAQVRRYLKYMSGNTVVLFFVSWLVLRNFPVGWRVGIFSGDISVPNRRFNLVTAVVTFSTLLWFGINKIRRKTALARSQNLGRKIIYKTQKQMFKNSLRTSALVGLGAYFITRQIPSAFELSIFTLELIAIFSPLTLDRVIQKTM